MGGIEPGDAMPDRIVGGKVGFPDLAQEVAHHAAGPCGDGHHAQQLLLAEQPRSDGVFEPGPCRAPESDVEGVPGILREPVQNCLLYTSDAADE